MTRRQRTNWLCRWFGINCPAVIPPDPPPQGDRAADAARAQNYQREQASLPALQYNACLASQAQEWSEEMERRGSLSHDGFSGRLRACEFGAGSENVAWGYTSGEGVVQGWMSSTGHRRNVLGNYSLTGIGVSGTYWCALYAR